MQCSNEVQGTLASCTRSPRWGGFSSPAKEEKKVVEVLELVEVIGDKEMEVV